AAEVEGELAAQQDAPPQLNEAREALTHLDARELAARLEDAEVEFGAQKLLERVIEPLVRWLQDDRAPLRPMHRRLGESVLRSYLDYHVQVYQAVQGPTALVAGTRGGGSELELLVLAAAAAQGGWQVVRLGPGLSSNEICAATREIQPGVVVLAAGDNETRSHRRELRRLERQTPESVQTITLSGESSPELVSALAAARLRATRSFRSALQTLRESRQHLQQGDHQPLPPPLSPSWSPTGNGFDSSSPLRGGFEASPPRDPIAREIPLSARARADFALSEEAADPGNSSEEAAPKAGSRGQTTDRDESATTASKSGRASQGTNASQQSAAASTEPEANSATAGESDTAGEGGSSSRSGSAPAPPAWIHSGDALSPSGGLPASSLAQLRQLAEHLTQVRRQRGDQKPWVRAGHLNALGLAHEARQRLIRTYLDERNPRALERALHWLQESFGRGAVDRMLRQHHLLFPRTDGEPESAQQSLERILLLWLLNRNPAARPLQQLFDDRELDEETEYRRMMHALSLFFASEPPALAEAATREAEQREGQRSLGPQDLFRLLEAPQRRSPDDLAGQLEILLEIHRRLTEARDRSVMMGLDVLREEDRPPFGGPGGPPPPGPPLVYDAEAATRARFAGERPWMREVVLVAKNVLVWFHQLSQRHGITVERLDQIPDAELAALSDRGFNCLWLVGLWRRSRASALIQRAGGQPHAAGSAYALDDYAVDEALGGEAALESLRQQASAHGLRLAADMVPNHMAIDSRWLLEQPEWFLSLGKAPFPGYSYTGEDLSPDPATGLYLEDGYRDRSDAAVVFRHVDRREDHRKDRPEGDGADANPETRAAESFVYHGNDGTGLPWNDTAQLDHANPEVQQLLLDTLVRLAQQFSVLRLDAAMVLARQHVQRLWHPRPGEGGAIPSRSEHALSPEVFDERMPEEFWSQAVERLAEEAPECLLVAEGFWMMEGYFTRELGMHRSYHSAFMHLLRDGDNQRFRELLREKLAFDPALLSKDVHYLTTPDEDTAAEQFGKGQRYFALTTLLATMPGLPLFGHGQAEGLIERYGMEYARPLYSEGPDAAFCERHLRQIAPLLQRRALFAQAEAFRLLDAQGKRGLNPDVIAFAVRRDDQAALVVVHNHQSSTTARLRRCVPTRDTETGALFEDDLLTALGLSPSSGVAPNTLFLHLRDALAQPGAPRDYLLPLPQVATTGLALTLPPHGAHVFLDPEVLSSEGDPRLPALAEELAGQPTIDLEQALERISS
ncbi:MAG: alpha-amylase family glycosyl hydrolase, partial [Acidobacteriota bacterium]